MTTAVYVGTERQFITRGLGNSFRNIPGFKEIEVNDTPNHGTAVTFQGQTEMQVLRLGEGQSNIISSEVVEGIAVSIIWTRDATEQQTNTTIRWLAVAGLAAGGFIWFFHPNIGLFPNMPNCCEVPIATGVVAATLPHILRNLNQRINLPEHLNPSQLPGPR